MMGALSQAEPRDYSAYISPAANVQHALKTVRTHLGMDVALVCEFAGDRLYFRHVSARRRSPVRAGEWLPLEHCYCPKVAEGRLPEIIPDTAAIPEALAPISARRCGLPTAASTARSAVSASMPTFPSTSATST
jgi:hypothetical protein